MFSAYELQNNTKSFNICYSNAMHAIPIWFCFWIYVSVFTAEKKWKQQNKNWNFLNMENGNQWHRIEFLFGKKGDIKSLSAFHGICVYLALYCVLNQDYLP